MNKWGNADDLICKFQDTGGRGIKARFGTKLTVQTYGGEIRLTLHVKVDLDVFVAFLEKSPTCIK